MTSLSDSEPLLEMRGIRKAFPGVVALDGVRFALDRGEVHVLLGENGAGKSTLMKVLSGAVRRDAGEILIDGEGVDIRGPRDAGALGISTIYQEFNLIPHLSAGENIFLGREPLLWPGIVDRRRLFRDAERVLAGLGVAFDPRTPIRELGLARQQMVEVAKALSAQARILIMDEPTSALTQGETRQLFTVIEQLTSRGVGVIYISHRMEEVFQIGRRVTVLRDGRYVATVRIAETSVGELVRLMANRELTEQFPRRPRPPTRAPGDELLKVERLGRGRVLHDVSFSLYRGEVLGIAGLLGAGRTELARAIVGADSIDSGRITVKGRPLCASSPTAAIRRGVGFLPEDRKRHGLVGLLSIRRNIGLPHADKLSHLGVVNEAAEGAMARRMVEELRIRTPDAERKVMLLSGGNQQKVVLGKWLAGEAEILIFDEPTRGIDLAAKIEIYHLINRLAGAGAGIIMISSELPEVLGMSDRILVMHQGRLAAELEAGSATEEQVLNAALGLAS